VNACYLGVPRIAAVDALTAMARLGDDNLFEDYIMFFMMSQRQRFELEAPYWRARESINV